MVTDQPEKRRSLDEIREHAMELREFAGPDWDGTREDLELLWEFREAFSRSVEKGELEEKVQSEPAKESELESCELSAKDAELLLAEVVAHPLEINVDQKKEKEDGERSL